MSIETDFPTRLKFTIGGFNNQCHEVEWKRGNLWYRRAMSTYLWEPAVRVTPAEEQWAAFWRELEIAGVWQWQADYPSDILDGTQWSLIVQYRERRIRCEGSNAYPGSPGPDYSPNGDFAHFLKALRSLTGQPAIR